MLFNWIIIDSRVFKTLTILKKSYSILLDFSDQFGIGFGIRISLDLWNAQYSYSQSFFFMMRYRGDYES